MKGMTLSVKSRDATPGYPGPERACSVVTATASTPKRATRGASASAIITVEQLGLVTINPRPVPRDASSSVRCSAFTSGMRSGTASSIRWEDELLITGYPAAANRVSTGPATSAGRLENTTSQSTGGPAACTTTGPAASGMSPGRRQAQAAA